MGNYYFTLNAYRATWSTTNSTTLLNDGVTGDETTFVQTTGAGNPPPLTAFFDFGSQTIFGSFSATFFVGSGIGGTAILEGTNTPTVGSSFVQIATLTALTGWNTWTPNGNGQSYEFYRLSLESSDDGTLGTNHNRISDWRFFSGGGSGGTGNAPLATGAPWGAFSLFPNPITVSEATATPWSAYNAAGQGGVTPSIGLASSGLFSVVGGWSVSIQYPVTVNVPEISAPAWSALLAVADFGWTQTVSEALSGNWSALRASPNIGPSLSVNLISAPAWSTYRALAQSGWVQSVSLISNSVWGSFTATVALGSQQNVATARGGSWVALAAAPETGTTFTVRFIPGTNWTSFNASARVGVALTVSLLSEPAWSSYAASAHVGVTESVSLVTSGSLAAFLATTELGVEISVGLASTRVWSPFSAMVQAGFYGSVNLVTAGAFSTYPATPYGTSTFAYAETATSPAWSVYYSIFAPVDGSEFPLVLRQKLQYDSRSNIWRPVRNAAGDLVYIPIIANLPGYVFSSPNRSEPEAGYGSLKQEGVFLYNVYRYPILADLRDGDAIQFFTADANPDNSEWFFAKSYPMNRSITARRRANFGEVYLNPTNKVPKLGVP